MSKNTYFIAGAQRSGTTLLSVILGRHTDVYFDSNAVAFRLVSCFSYYKRVLPYNTARSFSEIQSWLIENDYKGRLKALLDHSNLNNCSDAREMIAHGIQRKLSKENKKVFVDKVPNIEHFVPDMLMLMPEARFIHIVRDGRAGALSKKQRAHKNLYLAAQEWVDSNICGLSNQAMIGEERYKIIRYEDLLSSPESVLKEICVFLNIPFQDQMIEQEAGKNEEHRYVKSTLDSTKINAFQDQLTKRQIEKLEKIQGPLLQRFGYKLICPASTEHHQQLSIFMQIIYSQVDNFKQLFISKRIGMISSENVEVSIPVGTRIKAFIFGLGHDFLPDKVFKRVFRRRWIKSVYVNSEKR